MELKKSYKGFVIWMIAFVVICCIPALFPIEDVGLIVRFIGNLCTLGMAVLTFIIYKTGYVYWYTGIYYEDAVKAGHERRKIYALKHFKLFAGLALIYLVFSIIAQVTGVPFGVDLVLVIVGIVGVAISTIGVKL